jgi:hypothetical protein
LAQPQPAERHRISPRGSSSPKVMLSSTLLE